MIETTIEKIVEHAHAWQEQSWDKDFFPSSEGWFSTTRSDGTGRVFFILVLILVLILALV